MKDKKIKTILDLFFTFFKIGAFTFGGGYAMIPFIQRETVENHKWITDDDIIDIIAIAESTPGPIAINSATFVGYKVCGFWGAFACTFGVVLPPFVIILIISKILNEFQSIKAVQYAFYGIRAGVAALLIKALWTMVKKCPKNIVSFIIAAFAFLCVILFNVSVIFVIIICAVIGLITALISSRRKQQ